MSRKISAIKIEEVFELPIWAELEKQARNRRKNPSALLSELLREQLEVWEDETLDKEIRRDVRKSGYTEDDAVELVRQHRRASRHQPRL